MAVCTIARARVGTGPGILGPIVGIAASIASFQRKTTLALTVAADAGFARVLGATYSSTPALASDLRKVRRLGRDPAWLEASRSLSFTVALSLLIAFSFLSSFSFAYLSASFC
jgi:hypothetical protein